jgi:hypothetical protein
MLGLFAHRMGLLRLPRRSRSGDGA